MSRVPPENSTSFALPEWAGQTAGEPFAAWRHGYLWMRLARYDRAFACWAEAEEAALTDQVAVSRAAALRELGLHTPAEVLDLIAAAAATTAAVEAAALIGLVADAVGGGDVALARGRLASAEAAVGALEPGLAADRQRIRLGWVRAEVAMLSGAVPDVALPRLIAGRWDAPPEYAGGSQHHLAKGLLFAGVIDRDLAVLDRAAELAPPCLMWAIHLARRDLGAPGATEAAREAWGQVVLPPSHAAAVREVQRWAA